MLRPPHKAPIRPSRAPRRPLPPRLDGARSGRACEDAKLQHCVESVPPVAVPRGQAKHTALGSLGGRHVSRTLASHRLVQYVEGVGYKVPGAATRQIIAVIMRAQCEDCAGHRLRSWFYLRVFYLRRFGVSVGFWIVAIPNITRALSCRRRRRPSIPSSVPVSPPRPCQAAFSSSRSRLSPSCPAPPSRRTTPTRRAT